MPNLDNKGPGGLGSKTGKKLGKCRKTEIKMGKKYFFRKGTLMKLSIVKFFKINE